MKILGIDPGISGGWALVDTERCLLLDGGGLPIQSKSTGRKGSELDVYALRSMFGTMQAAKVILELAQPMPKQGGVSIFNYGRSFGQLEALIIGNLWPLHYVRPNVWKQRAGIAKQGKLASIAVCRRIFPNASAIIVKDSQHHIADAALIAYYG